MSMYDVIIRVYVVFIFAHNRIHTHLHIRSQLRICSPTYELVML